MRLFVAVELPPAVTAAAARVVDELRHRCDRLAPRARVTWVPPARMHLTLRFIGEADEPRTHRIEHALNAPCDLPAFDLEAARIAVFPAVGRPRVFWAGVAARGEALTELHRLVSARLDQAGVPPEARPFQPHLTLGRVREGAGLPVRQVLDGLTDVELGRVRVTEIVLFESRQSKDGPEYVARGRTRLLR